MAVPASGRALDLGRPLGYKNETRTGERSRFTQRKLNMNVEDRPPSCHSMWGWELRLDICIALAVEVVREWIMSGLVTSLSLSRTALIGLIRSKAEFRQRNCRIGLIPIGGKFFKVPPSRISWSSERIIAAIGYGNPRKECNWLNISGSSERSNFIICRTLKSLLEAQIW